MRPRLHLGRVAGIPVRIEASVLVVALLISLTLAYQVLPARLDLGGGLRATLALAGTIVFLGSILAHELGHALAARRHGVETTEITLWLLGGVAKLTRQAPNPAAEFQIAVAGPAVNLVLGVVGGLAAWYGLDHSGGAFVIAAWLVGMNLLLAVFNLLPAAPLDGGRVLVAALWPFTGESKARRWAGRFGFVFGLALAAGSLLVAFRTGDPAWVVNALIGGFIAGAARSQVRAAEIRCRLDALTLDDLMTPRPLQLPEDLTVSQAVAWAGPAGDVAFPVGRGHETVGYVTPTLLASKLGPAASWTTLAAVMEPAEVVRRHWRTEAGTALFDDEGRAPNITVVHDPATGHVVGTVSGSRLAAVIDGGVSVAAERQPTPA